MIRGDLQILGIVILIIVVITEVRMMITRVT